MPQKAVLFRRPSAALGIVWGLVLESFQIALYPDWLGIRFVNEFIAFSALGHVAYGATLGFALRRKAEIDVR